MDWTRGDNFLLSLWLTLMVALPYFLTNLCIEYTFDFRHARSYSSAICSYKRKYRFNLSSSAEREKYCFRLLTDEMNVLKIAIFLKNKHQWILWQSVYFIKVSLKVIIPLANTSLRGIYVLFVQGMNRYWWNLTQLFYTTCGCAWRGYSWCEIFQEKSLEVGVRNILPYFRNFKFVIVFSLVCR